VYESLSPQWEWSRVFWLRPEFNLEVVVMDRDHLTFDKQLGQLSVPIRGLEDGLPMRAWHPLSTDGSDKPCGEVELSLTMRDGTQYKDTMLEVTVLQAQGLAPTDAGGLSDPFSEISYGMQTSRTATKFKTLEPQWNTMFAFDYKPLCDVKVEVFDHDVFFMFASKSFIGQVTLSQHELTFNEPVQQWHPMVDSVGKEAGKLEVRLAWVANTEYKNSKLEVKVLGARNLKAMDMDGNSDPYAVLTYGKQESRGNQAHQTLNPKWDHRARFEFLSHEVLSLTVYDADDSNYNSDDFMGKIEIPVRSELEKDQPKRAWYSLLDERSCEVEGLGEVEVEITWVDGPKVSTKE